MDAVSRETKLSARVAELEAALVRARGVSESLREVGMAVGNAVDLDELLTIVLNAATHVLQADRATIYVRDGDSLISRVKNDDALELITVPLGKGVAGQVAETGRPIRIRDAYKDARFDPSWDKMSGYRTRAILAVPLKDHTGKVIGVIQALNKISADDRPTVFTPYDTELLNALATQAAVSFEKSQLFQRLTDHKIRLERSVSDLALLYELETALSRSSSVEQLARQVIKLTAEACRAEAGALLFESRDGVLTLYVVNTSDVEEVREVCVQHGEGIAGRAMAQNESIQIDDPELIRDPGRVRELLGIDVRSALASPLAEGKRVCGAIALYNRDAQPSSFSEDDASLLRLVSANVSTELRVFEERHERERAERLGTLGRLLSGVMHDLRTPLTIISGYVQLMEVTDDKDSRASYAQTVSEQFELIGAMQQELLAYARGERKVWIRKIILKRFLDQFREQVVSGLRGKNVEFQIDFDRKAIAFFDEAKILRALNNLVNNAIEAMDPDGGKLRIECEERGDDIEFCVTDSGPGIPKEIRDKLFEPFVTAGKETGTGLGLSIVKRIAEEHGGSVEMSSSADGTSFILRLPHAVRLQSRRPPPALGS